MITLPIHHGGGTGLWGFRDILYAIAPEGRTAGALKSPLTSRKFCTVRGAGSDQTESLPARGEWATKWPQCMRQGKPTRTLPRGLLMCSTAGLRARPRESSSLFSASLFSPSALTLPALSPDPPDPCPLGAVAEDFPGNPPGTLRDFFGDPQRD